MNEQAEEKFTRGQSKGKEEKGKSAQVLKFTADLWQSRVMGLVWDGTEE